MMTIAVALLVTSYFYAALLLPTYAEQNDENVAVGVKVGDWIKYDFTHVNSLSRLENDWTKVEVKNVSGTIVTIHISTEYPNDTYGHMEYAELTLNVDVNENLIEAHDWSPCDLVDRYMPYVIAANLSTGDYAFNDLVDKINDNAPSKSAKNNSFNNGIVVRQYGETAREVVLVNQSFDEPMAEDFVRVSVEYCWDRSAGLLLEYAITISPSRAPTHYIEAIFMRVVDTNLWKMPQPSPPWDQIAVGMVLPVTAIMLIVTVQERKTAHRKVQK